MNRNQDLVVYNESYLPDEIDKHESPFIKKEYIRVQNEGGAGVDFNRNEIVWNTIAVSNNGKMTDYRNSYLEIPVVCHLTTSAVGADVDPDVGIKAVRMKAAHAIIDSIVVEYNNTTLVQSRRNISGYASFKEHTTLALDDVLLEGSGYIKPSYIWNYTAASGLTNGRHTSQALLPPLYELGDNQGALGDEDVIQSGMDYYVYTDAVAAVAANGGTPAVARVPAMHTYYFTCKIPLKKLIFFDKMPLVRGANLKITCGLNQCDISTTYTDNAGTVSQIASNIKGSCCPVIVSRDDHPGAATVETLSVKVVRSRDITGQLLTHSKTTCDLVIPCYQMSGIAERDYLSIGTKQLTYTDVQVSFVQNKTPGNFSELLTNSISKLQRLIIIPMLSRQQPVNGNTSRPQETPYTMEPTSCSPYQINNFQVQLSGVNVYEGGGVKYKYDHFLNEIKGKFGPCSGLECGMVAGQISEFDYNNTMGYFCVDLSRRQAVDFDTPVSVQIQGYIKSPLMLDFLCYLEFEREITLDLTTSALL